MEFLVQKRLIDPKQIPITILLSLLLCKLVASDNIKFGTCLTNYTETVDNRTGQVPYQSSLQSLFNNLTTTGFSNSLSYYNTTAGEPPNKSYGMYLCRGDATSKICRSCVSNVTDWIVSSDLYANCTEFLASSDHCTLRYANYSFFGKASTYTDLGYIVDKYSKTISQAYNSTLEGAVQRVTTEAAYSSRNLFATAEAKVDDGEKVYALAQCTPDISRGDCEWCLKAAYEHAHLTNTTGFIKEAWVSLPNCELRYDNDSFYGGGTAASTLAPPLVSTVFMLTTLSMFVIGIL